MVVRESEVHYKLSGGIANTDPLKALGGGISQSSISNDSVNNLWDDVDSIEAHEGDTEYRCFYIYNGSATDTFAHVTIQISQKSVNSTDEVNLGLGTSAIGGVEQAIVNESTAPVGVTFIPVGHKVVIGNIPPAKWKAIWIRRIVKDHSQPMKDNNYIIRCQGKEAQDESIPPTPTPDPAPGPLPPPTGGGDTGGSVGQKDIFDVVMVYPSETAGANVSDPFWMNMNDITTSDRMTMSVKNVTSGPTGNVIPAGWYWPDPKSQTAGKSEFPSSGAPCGHSIYRSPNFINVDQWSPGKWAVRIYKPQDFKIFQFGDFPNATNANAYKTYLQTCQMPTGVTGGIPDGWEWPDPKGYTDNQNGRNFGFPTGGAACGHSFYKSPNETRSYFNDSGFEDEGWEVAVFKPGGARWDFGDFVNKANADAYRHYLLTCELPNTPSPTGAVTKVGANTWSTKGDTQIAIAISGVGKAAIASKMSSQPTSFWESHTAHKNRGYILYPHDWKNVEITVYFKCKAYSGALQEPCFKLGGRGMSMQLGPNATNCSNMWYTGLIYLNGQVGVAKELGGYGNYMPVPLKQSAASNLHNQLFGFKVMIYNTSNDTNVKTEVWLDKNNNQNWVRVYDLEDTGNWNPLINAGSGAPSCGANSTSTRYTWGSSWVKISWHQMTDVEFSKVSVRPITPTAVSTPPTPAPTDTKITVEQSGVTANGDDGNKPSNVRDGQLTTRWSKSGLPGILTMDMGSSKRVAFVRIAWYKGNERVMDFNIQTSTDNITYTTRFTGKSSGTSTNVEQYDINPDVTCRYVRINVIKNSQNNFASITEAELWGGA